MPQQKEYEILEMDWTDNEDGTLTLKKVTKEVTVLTAQEAEDTLVEWDKMRKQERDRNEPEAIEASEEYAKEIDEKIDELKPLVARIKARGFAKQKLAIEKSKRAKKK